MNEKEKKPVKSDSQDIEQHKALAAIGYIAVLCFVPLMKKESAYAQFHAKQGLALFIIEVVSFVLSWTVILAPIAWVIGVACLFVSLYGIYLAMNGEQKEIPGLSHIVKKFNL